MVWDKGLEFNRAKKMIRDAIKELEIPESVREEKQLTYWCVLAVQLNNGVRVSEAVDALREFTKTGDRKVTVLVRKKRKEKEYRPVVIPKIVKDDFRDWFREYIFDERIVKRIIAWASKHGINTHNFRYSWITNKLLEGNNPIVVAKAVRHSKVDMVLRYAQKIEADKLVKDDL